MKQLLIPLLSSVASSSENNSNSGTGSTESITKALKDMVKSPVFYIVIGGLILLIIVVYLLRRVIKPRPNLVSVVIRKVC